ncbi:MAG TPA: hypothetical protein VJ743_16950, partial [Albitalea sp.]|nr:hypothetical protein [Albitalea sp.]
MSAVPAAPAAAARNLTPPQRVPLLMLGFVALFAGVGAGLARLGWPMPALLAGAAGIHGPLMVCGFFGVVISLERAVAIGRLWAYVAPLAAGAGTLLALAGAPVPAAWLGVLAAAMLLAGSLDVWHRQPALFTFTMALGAAAWLAGALLWAGGAASIQVLPWWLAFLVLTIAGERLELSRLLPPSRSAVLLFAAILGVTVAALAGSLRWHAGEVVFAGGLLALALWLLRHDIARRTVRGRGLTRFIAVCLLFGHAWLAVGAAIALAAGGFAAGTGAYDAALHAIVLGFVFSMVFGHAPVIFPAVLRVQVPYRRFFYGPLALLQLSLLVRLAGDALGQADCVRAGGALNAAALAA